MLHGIYSGPKKEKDKLTFLFVTKLLIAPPGEPIRLVSHQSALKIDGARTASKIHANDSQCVQGFKHKLLCWKIIFFIALSFLLSLSCKNKKGPGVN